MGSEIDYNTYNMSILEKLFYILLAALLILAISYIFFRSAILSVILCTLSLYYPTIRKRELIRKRKIKLNLQFKDMLYILASNLAAGKSLEMAFIDMPKDLKVIYPDINTSIVRESEIIAGKINMNITVEKALSDFAQRSHIENIRNFADVVRTCKRMGGDIVEVIVNTSNIINDKIETEQEIEMMLTEKRFEQKVLNICPVGLILLLSLSAPDYMEPVFTTLTGRIVMGIAVLLFAAAYIISNRIMHIEI